MDRITTRFFLPRHAGHLVVRRDLGTVRRSVALVLVLSGLSGLLLPGCQAPPAAGGPTDMLMRIPDHSAFMDATLSLLRRYDLPAAAVDRERGTIVTARATSGQWFEPWRIDSQGSYQVLESSLHTMARTASITITPAAEGDDQDTYRVAVQVEKWRYSAPERQITTASGALAIYSEDVPTAGGARRADGRGVTWVPLGRDGLLEAYLLAKLADVTPSAERVY